MTLTRQQQQLFSAIKEFMNSDASVFIFVVMRVQERPQ